MYFDNSSNARRKRKLAAKIQKSVARERAGYRAAARERQEAKRKTEQEAALREFAARYNAALQAPVQPPLLQVPTPEVLAARIELARQYRERCKLEAA